MESQQQHKVLGASASASGGSGSGIGGSGGMATLKRPMPIVKKRSGPLDDVLSELQQLTDNKEEAASASTPAIVSTSVATPAAGSSSVTKAPKPTPRKSSQRRRDGIGDAVPSSSSASGGGTGGTGATATTATATLKEKKRSERWLLTRKTWKYMQDAGRKLIPDGAQNRREDIPKIEAHFQQICATEPRFILWRRKCSYPGASRNSRRRLKQLLQHTGRHQQQQQQRERDEWQNAERLIELLQTHLKLDTAFKTTTLLSAKTVRPDQTASPSAQRPNAIGGGGGGVGGGGFGGVGFTGGEVIGLNVGAGGSLKFDLSTSTSLLPSATTTTSSSQQQQYQQQQQQLSPSERESQRLAQLLERLRLLAQSNSVVTSLPPSLLTQLTQQPMPTTLLDDKQLLKQIYNTLKKQQLHRSMNQQHMPIAPLPHQHTSSAFSGFGSGGGGGGGVGSVEQLHLKHSISLSSLIHFGLGSSGGGNDTDKHRTSHSPQSTTMTTTTTATAMATATTTGASASTSGSSGGGIIGASLLKKTPLCCNGSRTNSNSSSNMVNLRSTANTSTVSSGGGAVRRQRKAPNTLPLSNAGGGGMVKTSRKATAAPPPPPERQYNTCGTQTNFIQLPEIKRLAEEYKELRRQNDELDAPPTSVTGGGGGGVSAASSGGGGGGGGGGGNTDEELDTRTASGSGGSATDRMDRLRRKSSIDNEDVSQSVSDTIKRYLRMARKKSVHEDANNRFKRVNYDRNLRNIRAKGEINPPGMDEGNSKAIQTLDAWPLITLNGIRGLDNEPLLAAAHAEWQRTLDERIRVKLNFEQKMAAASGGSDAAPSTNTSTAIAAAATTTTKLSSGHSASAPTSPTTPMSSGSGSGSGSVYNVMTSSTMNSNSNSSAGVGGNTNLFHTSSQFFSNLWHSGNSTHHQHQLSPDSSNTIPRSHQISESNKTGDKSVAMQKSKSSSNVGQFVSRKLLKNRSKSQTRSATALATTPASNDLLDEFGTQSLLANDLPPLPKWMPGQKLHWRSETGDEIIVGDVTLQQLSDLEAKILQHVALEKISELNLDINLSRLQDATASNSGNPNGGGGHKSQLKRRVLPKKKAMTTSFFDIGKKVDDSLPLSLFGNSLEMCLANESKRTRNRNSSGSSDVASDGVTMQLLNSAERGSRNSIASLFRHSIGVDSSREDLRSCGSSGDNSNYRTLNGKNAKISQSQTDVRRRSEDYASIDLCLSPTAVAATTTVAATGAADTSSCCELQVPKFVTTCIKYLEDNGMQQIGLFRVSTSKKRVKQLRDDFDKSNQMPMIQADTCPHDVATLLKEFLRDLPEPLICNNLYKAFIETQRIRNRRLQLEAVSHLVKLLPAAHRDTLYVLLKFLAKVAAHSDDAPNVVGNKMDSNNLATVFAPNILRLPASVTAVAHLGGGGGGEYNTSMLATNAASSAQETMNDAINVIRIMIDHFEEIYRVPAELIDTVYSYMHDVCPEQLYLLCQQRNTANVPNEQQMYIQQQSQQQQQQQQTQQRQLQQQPQQQSSQQQQPKIPKRLYTRESVMHHHDAASNVTVHSNIQQQQQQQLQQQRDILNQTRTKRIYNSDDVSGRAGGGAGGTTITGTGGGSGAGAGLGANANNMLDMSQLSTNSNNCDMGILKASLQISVPTPKSNFFTNITNSNSSVNSGSSTSNNNNCNIIDIGSKYSNIPYIEDTSCEYAPISGSLSFSTKMDVPNQQQQQQHYSDSNSQTYRRGNYNDNNNNINSSSSGGRSGSANNEMNLVPSGVGVGGANNNSSTRLNVKEPKLPASISNIGGAILRSKTADFERMSHVRSSAAAATPAQISPSSSAAPATVATSTSSPQLNQLQRTRHQSNIAAANTAATTNNSRSSNNNKNNASAHHIYKRQELILSSSSKRN